MRNEATRVSEQQTDPVNRPAHYVGDGLEAIEVIEDWQLGFHLGNAVKYVLRAGRKGDRRQDLEKALWYVRRAQGRPPGGQEGGLDIERISDAFELRALEANAVLSILLAVKAQRHWWEHLQFAVTYLKSAIIVASLADEEQAAQRPSGQAAAGASAGSQHDSGPTSDRDAATRVRTKS